MIIKILENIGRPVIGYLVVTRDFAKLLLDTLYWIVVGPLKGKPVNGSAVSRQMVFMGVQSIVIVIFVTFFTGVVLAMQSSYQLSKMGAKIYVASLTSISICRELGPVLTALVIAGRIG
ncbi:MAG: ABC transporter permease, partial [Candidatus Omnitrophica bacterium]|nr:ABC transporter permease [Candidatus Omnitrophota bacterium]